jgi:hypothetical protein|tara:strand:- start:409 stop:1044 length:636 start_codon:yes stop_codon:yes gene_type:complete
MATAKKTTAKKVAEKPSVWSVLSKIDCSEHVQKKGRFNYLSWTWAWAILMENYPEATFVNHYNENGYPVFLDPSGYAMVRVTVTINGVQRTEDFAVTNNNNKSIELPSSSDVNTALKRCMVKCLAYFGLGHYIYAGEDLPQDAQVTEEPSVAFVQKPAAATSEQVESILAAIRADDNPSTALKKTLAWAGVKHIKDISAIKAAKLLDAQDK